MKAKTWAIACGLAVCLLTKTAVAGPTEDAAAAYKRGDYAIALLLIRPLAEQGDAVAQYILGDMYVKGQGVSQDNAEAVKWYRLAADQGYASAQGNLGILYANGIGVPQDYAEAVKWLRKAADQGYPPYILAIMCENGVGTPQDYVQAYKWFKLAGTPNGLTRVAKKMTSAQITEAKRLAQEWLVAHPKK